MTLLVVIAIDKDYKLLVRTASFNLEKDLTKRKTRDEKYGGEYFI